MAQTRQETSCRWAPYLAAKALGGMLRWLFDSLGRATPSRVCGHAIFPSTHSHIEAPSVTKAQPRPPLFHQKISAFHTPNQSIYAGGTCFTSFFETTERTVSVRIIHSAGQRRQRYHHCPHRNGRTALPTFRSQRDRESRPSFQSHSHAVRPSRGRGESDHCQPCGRQRCRGGCCQHDT